MKVKDLIKQLQKFPKDRHVVIESQGHQEPYHHHVSVVDEGHFEDSKFLDVNTWEECYNKKVRNNAVRIE